MKWLQTCALIIATGWSPVAHAQLQLRPDQKPQNLFGGGNRAISLIWHNDSDQAASVKISARILQTSSATVMLFSESAWKELQVLPRQTVMESAQLNFPTVRAGTKFLVQWFENTNHILGQTEVMIYPTNLLAELSLMAGGQPVGLLDPQNLLKPLLKELKVNFTDLESCDLSDFSGHLAIIGPFFSKTQMRDGLTSQVRALARKGTAILWFQQPPEKSDQLVPSFYPVIAGTNAVIIAQSDLANDLAGDPNAQLHLIYLCRLALKPATLSYAILQP